MLLLLLLLLLLLMLLMLWFIAPACPRLWVVDFVQRFQALVSMRTHVRAQCQRLDDRLLLVCCTVSCLLFCAFVCLFFRPVTEVLGVVHPRETAPNTTAHGTAWFPTSPRVVANITMQVTVAEKGAAR